MTRPHCSPSRPLARRSLRARGVALGLAALALCGCAPSAPPQARTTPTVLPIRRPPQVAAAAPVWKIETLVDVIPADATVVAHLPRPDALLQRMPPALLDDFSASILSELGTMPGLDTTQIGALATAFDDAVVFVGPSGHDPVDPERRVCSAIRFKDPAPVERLLSLPIFRKTGDERFAIEHEQQKVLAYGAWLKSARVALLCREPKLLSTALRVADQREPSFRTSPLFKPERAEGAWVTMDLARFVGRSPGAPEAGSRLAASFSAEPGAPNIELQFVGHGGRFPPLGALLAPTRHTMITRLPKGPVSAFSVSLQRMPGKTLADLFVAAGSSMETAGVSFTSLMLSGLGLDLPTLDGALGGEVALGLYVDPKRAPEAGKDRVDTIHETSTMLLSVATASEAARQKVFQVALAQAKKKPKRFRVKGNTIIADAENGQELRAELRPGQLLIGTGDRKLVADLFARFGREGETLGASPAFAATRAQTPPEGHLLAYLDPGVLSASIAGVPGIPPSAADRSGALLALTLAPSDRGLEFTATSHGGVSALGDSAALAIFGVQRYLARAKTAEAKSMVTAMFRSAAASFERERLPASLSGSGSPSSIKAVHKLCGAANAVPASVPKGTKYVPSESPGQDFNQGDDDTGWRCLRFAASDAMYYQLDYRAGGGYKGPARGGPDPGKDGFEVSAEGDLDGDGKTSLFTRTGRIVNGELVLDESMFIADELE
ncbi:hypothetical protein [Chondromyces crocatus]|nr:hypothetical protein [Chondromyces crocatus]